MRWSWRLGQVAGTGLDVHFTFLLLLGWLVAAHFLARYRVEDAVEELVFVLLLFSMVVLHELGHAFAARHYGIATRDITLLPIGGVARLERMPEDPRQELVVALAGPAVNLLLAASMTAWLSPRAAWQALVSSDLQTGTMPGRLFVVNAWIFLFNLLPAFPMDGGRVLRALLALRGDYVAATQTAAGIGQVVALVLGFLGLFGNPLYVFIALFVYIGASQEAGMVQVRSALAGIPVSRVMVRDFHVLVPTDSLETAARHVLGGFPHDFPVVDGGKVVGVLTRGGLLSALAREGERGRVGDAMHQGFQTVDPAEMLEQAMVRLEDCHCRSMPVVRDGRLVGLLTMDNLGEFLMTHSARRATESRRGQPVVS